MKRIVIVLLMCLVFVLPSYGQVKGGFLKKFKALEGELYEYLYNIRKELRETEEYHVKVLSTLAADVSKLYVQVGDITYLLTMLSKKGPESDIMLLAELEQYILDVDLTKSSVSAVHPYASKYNNEVKQYYRKVKDLIEDLEEELERE